MVIKYYGTDDLATAFCINEAFELLEKFNLDMEHDINEIICLENCLEYIDHGVIPRGYDEAKLEQIKKKRSDICKTIGNFWNNLTTDNIKEMPIIEQEYHDDFLANFVKHKLENRISKILFWENIKTNNIELRIILGFKELVDWLDDEIRNLLLNEPSGMELLVDIKLVHRENEELFLPKSLTRIDIDGVMAKYVDHGNINLVRLISESSIEMGISDKTRLKAKKKYEKDVDNFFKEVSGVEYGIKTQIIKHQAVPIAIETKDNVTSISFSEKYFLDSLASEASIFKVLKTSFGVVDSNFVMRMPSYRSELSIYERYLSVRGKKHYPCGAAFEIKNWQILSGLVVYENFLNSHDKSIEDVAAWFFGEYLNARCGIRGFHYSKSSSKTFYEKAKNLFTEADAVIRQYKMFVDDGMIDKELLELSSKPVDFGEIKSLKQNKYYYLNEKREDVALALGALFSDQSHLSYIDDRKHDVNLFSLLANNDLKREDFLKYQTPHIDWLINLGFLTVSDSGKIEVTIYAWILGIINRIEAIPYYSYNEKIQKDIEKMAKDGWLIPNNKLLTESEIKYFYYVLNRKEFINGLDLRNKYIHGSKSLVVDESIHSMAYMRGLLLMVALMIKIDDDLRD